MYGKLDFNHDKHNENELGWKLFTLELCTVFAKLTVKLGWIAALMWAFTTILNHKF